ncbi:fructose 1,6-bisphosphate 1-phosphatase [Aureococcus anophagefferens]|nr:fructose 1,6-bisphosphate 1-phosphatase [Aureococcus anophagefferens]
MYSSSTILVFTCGDGVNGFTLDPKSNEFVLSHANLTVPATGPYYSFNEGNAPHWDGAVVEYLDGLKREKGYSARYIGSMVADVHRTLLYGGVYGYPADAKNANGKLRLLYEAAPMSFIVEQAGGRSTTGAEPIMAIVPDHATYARHNGRLAGTATLARDFTRASASATAAAS